MLESVTRCRFNKPLCHAVSVESRGALGEEASASFRNLGHRIASVNVEPRSFQFMMQRLSVAVQRGNAACVLGTVPASIGLDALFYA